VIRRPFGSVDGQTLEEVAIVMKEFELFHGAVLTRFAETAAVMR